MPTKKHNHGPVSSSIRFSNIQPIYILVENELAQLFMKLGELFHQFLDILTLTRQSTQQYMRSVCYARFRASVHVTWSCSGFE